MVRRKPVKSLKSECLRVLPSLLRDHIRRLAHKTAALKWFGIMEGNVEIDKEDTLARQVRAMREYIFGQVIWYDYEAVFKCLSRGVEDAIARTRRSWKMSSNMEDYRKEMDAMAAFTEVVLFPYLRKLEFSEVPTSLRSRIVENFALFEHLRVLDLGSDTGAQWLFKSNLPHITNGLEKMCKLEHFSCKKDTNATLLKALSVGCSKTLLSLDVEGSKGVNDSCAEIIHSFTRVEQLNIFGTKLEDEAKAKILLALRNLTCLVRGDFLCEALEWIDYFEEEQTLEGETDFKAPQLLLTDFFPSQEYFFHEEWQLELLQRLCPFISRMLFIFHETCVESYLTLAGFEYLTELDVYAGDFFRHKIKDLLEVRGHGLKKLSLISIRNVNYLALAHISKSCPNLQSLYIHNCDLGDFIVSGQPDSDAEYNRWHKYLDMTRQAMALIRPYANLKEVSVQSPCKATHLTFLLGNCPELKRLQLGYNTKVSDEVVQKIFDENRLHNLEEFHVERSTELTMVTLQFLLENCPNLKSVSDIQNWAPGLPASEVGVFRQLVFDRNLDLDTRSHRQIRRILEMHSCERNTHLNVLAGPTLERIRRAEQERQGAQ